MPVQPCRSTTRQPYGIDIAFASLIRPGQAPTFAASSFLIGNHHRLCQTSTAVAVSMEPNENRTDPDLPPVAALFVVYFDKRKGYTLGWHQTIAKVKLEDSVEYKSLPSGLHSLKEDVIYFIHEEYAGVSAFVTYPAEESRRNAVMLAVGALVPLSMGRLGRSWQHVPHLQALASKIAEERPDLESGEMPLPDLGKYWFINQTRDDDVLPRQGSPPPSPLSIRSLDGQSSAVGPRTRDRRTRDRQIRSSSGSTASDPQSHRLPESHPALSLPDLYDVLGPLLFPLYRAALLRKRILFVCEAPIRRACHFVYDIALLADIPASAAGVIPSRGPPSRSSLLYSIGIHDIPFLEEVARTTAASVPVRYPTDASAWRSSAGWIACTTDRLIAGRPKLFDVLVHLPSQSSGGAGGKRWARIESSDGHKIRATQRDLRRHLLLQRSLRKMHDAWHLSESPLELDVDPYDLQVDDGVLEPLSWPALTYTSFMWWASAGEEPGDLEGPTEEEEPLLEGFASFALQSSSANDALAGGDDEAEVASQCESLPEMALIAYFRRLTTSMLTDVANMIDNASDEDDRSTAVAYDESRSLRMRSRDISQLGLDVWSARDIAFAEELTRKYFGVVAQAQGAGIECCGMRIC